MSAGQAERAAVGARREALGRGSARASEAVASRQRRERIPARNARASRGERKIFRCYALFSRRIFDRIGLVGFSEVFPRSDRVLWPNNRAWVVRFGGQSGVV